MHRHISAAAVVCAATLAACSKAAPNADSAAVAQAGAANAAGYDPTTRVATIIAKDFAFEAPDSIPAGWTTLRMVNEGATLHHVQLVRLDGGKTFADMQAAMQNPNAPPPAWIVAVGGPNGPDPKSTSTATLNLPAGNYAMLCFIDIPGKVPHIAKGMARPLVVTSATEAGTEPVADITVSLTDYAFTTTSGALAAGKHVVKVVNDGAQDHELVIIRLQPGKTLQDLGAWAATAEGLPPGNGIAGVSGVVKGGVAYFDAEFTPGSYVMLCFIPDSKDKKPHIEHGMVKEFTVQ
jgi:hypothetical protein